ncbi:MAG: YbbR-like domain-containing protein [Flavobacteriaceae bacterium]
MKEKKKNIRSRKKTQIKVVFLLLAIVFWTLSKLSKEYNHSIVFNTKYVNKTNDKVLQKPAVSDITVHLKTNGFKLLTYNLKTPSIAIDLKQLYKQKNKYYYLTNSNIPYLQNQLSSEETILRIEPDTLFFDFGILKTKKVSVNPILKLQYGIGYDAVSTQIIPDSISIVGPKKQIDVIKSINTIPLELSNISNNITKKLQLDIPDNNKISYSNDFITFKVKVDKFSQGNLEVEYKIINVPNGIKINTFSKQVKLTYKVSLNNYDKVKASDFEIVCDYLNTKNNNLKYLIPTINKKSNLVSDIKITPKTLEFLYKND